MVLSLDEYPPAARDDLDPNPTTTHLLCEGRERERERVGDHRSLMFLNMKAMKQVRTLEPSLFGRSEHKKTPTNQLVALSCPSDVVPHQTTTTTTTKNLFQESWAQATSCGKKRDELHWSYWSCN